MSEAMARAIFSAAIYERRCAELLNALFDGGSATIDPITDKLVIASAQQLAQLGGDQS